MDIVGAPEVELEFSADKPVALRRGPPQRRVARPARSRRITYGLLNLSHRDSHEFPTPLEPGKRYRMRIKLDDIAWRIPKGHRIARRDLDHLLADDVAGAGAGRAHRVHAGKPLDPAAASARADDRPPPQFPEPLAAPAVALEALREPANRRDVAVDPATGRVELTISDDFGCYRNGEHGMIAGSIGRETHAITPGDPLSARMTTHWTEELRRDAGHGPAGGSGPRPPREMTATRSHFHLKARIEAYEGDALVFARDFDEEIPRDLN